MKNLSLERRNPLSRSHRVRSLQEGLIPTEICRIDHNVFNEILIVISFFLNSVS